MIHVWAIVNGNWQYFGQRPVQRTDNITPGVFETLEALRSQGLGQFFLMVAVFTP